MVHQAMTFVADHKLLLVLKCIFGGHNFGFMPNLLQCLEAMIQVGLL